MNLSAEEVLMTDFKNFTPDNDDYAPEGNSFVQINRNLARFNSGSTKQIVRACVDDSGTKVAGSASDETDVTNNCEGFILFGEPSGSLELTLQGRNLRRTHKRQEQQEQRYEMKLHGIKDTAERQFESNQEHINQMAENLKRTNELFYPFSTILCKSG
jgi:hypothetical protein